jgi:hypothetical protein
MHGRLCAGTIRSGVPPRPDGTPRSPALSRRWPSTPQPRKSRSSRSMKRGRPAPSVAAAVSATKRSRCAHHLVQHVVRRRARRVALRQHGEAQRGTCRDRWCDHWPRRGHVPAPPLRCPSGTRWREPTGEAGRFDIPKVPPLLPSSPSSSPRARFDSPRLYREIHGVAPGRARICIKPVGVLVGTASSTKRRCRRVVNCSANGAWKSRSGAK